MGKTLEDLLLRNYEDHYNGIVLLKESSSGNAVSNFFFWCRSEIQNWCNSET